MRKNNLTNLVKGIINVQERVHISKAVVNEIKVKNHKGDYILYE